MMRTALGTLGIVNGRSLVPDGCPRSEAARSRVADDWPGHVSRIFPWWIRAGVGGNSRRQELAFVQMGPTLLHHAVAAIAVRIGTAGAGDAAEARRFGVAAEIGVAILVTRAVNDHASGADFVPSLAQGSL